MTEETIAMTQKAVDRLVTGGKSKLAWVHSVMGKAQFEFTVTN